MPLFSFICHSLMTPDLKKPSIENKEFLKRKATCHLHGRRHDEKPVSGMVFTNGQQRKGGNPLLFTKIFY
jgi:hypothetical protein